MYRYIILFPLSADADRNVRSIMDMISEHTYTSPPYSKLPPHITFHKPIRGIRESTICAITETMAREMKCTDVVLGRIAHFSKHYIVLPVHTTLSLAHFWTGVSIQFSQLPEYEKDAYEENNSLHIALAKKTTKIFDTVWPHVKDIELDLTCTLSMLEIWRKPIHGVGWEKFKQYQLQNNYT
jgi:2'-5' RNA ligase